ncbi:hypothetical protein [Hymenobacter psychrotolerans]|uniref:hypothetical protein n=1 Tax=Hymenobacter psychrotolerans TaxID=344998 RepID=UPI00147DFD46|nr:hypothetical protein [Hymenobacter psychrotolerans]
MKNIVEVDTWTYLFGSWGGTLLGLAKVLLVLFYAAVLYYGIKFLKKLLRTRSIIK